MALVEANRAKRHLHTRQGLHLNQMGKIWLADNNAEAIYTWSEPQHNVESRQPPPPGVGTLSENIKESSTHQQPK